MPKKGSTYATIGVDLQKWLEDWREETGDSHAEVARKLSTKEDSVHRARMTEMAKGLLNTMMFLEKVGERIYKGDYLKMAKYAMTDAGLDILKDRDIAGKLTPYQRDVLRQIVKKAQEDVLDDPDKDEVKRYLGK